MTTTLVVIAAVFALIVAWLIVELVRDHVNDRRKRPVIRSVDYGQASDKPPPPTPTETTVRRLERDVANGERIIESLWAELELRTPADQIVRRLRDGGPLSTAALIEALDLDRIEANRRLLHAEEHGLVSRDRQGSETVWTFTGDQIDNVIEQETTAP